jgi:hypothetical protein
VYKGRKIGRVVLEWYGGRVRFNEMQILLANAKIDKIITAAKTAIVVKPTNT